MKSRHIAALGTTLLMASILTACSSSDEEVNDDPSVAEAAANAEVESITLGVMQIGAAVPVQYGIEEGIFEEHGFDVELSFARGGSVMVPAVQTGEYEFAITNPLTIMQSNAAGLDMKILTGFAYAYPDGDDVHGVVTRADSAIESFGDLAGNTMAVNTLETQGDLSILEAAERDGADPQDISFSEIAFPEMEAQLELGNVDAVWLPEPFLGRATANPENRLVGYSAQESVPGMPMLSSFTSAAYAEENPEIVERFEAALTEVLEASAENEEDARSLLPDFMGVPVEATQNMRLEEWSAELRQDLIDEIGELAVKYDFIDEVPDNLYLD